MQTADLLTIHSVISIIKYSVIQANIHEKLLGSDWLGAAQFKCNTSAKSVTP